MRLRDINKIINDNIDKLNFEFHQVNINNNSYQQVTNIPTIIFAIQQMKDFNFIKPDIDKLYKLPNVYQTKASPINLIQVEFDEFFVAITNIKNKCIAVQEAINQTIKPQDESSISIKFPPIDTISELTEYLKTLDVAFSRAITIEDFPDKKINVQSFETGSFWIDLKVGEHVLNFFANLIKSAINIRNEMYRGDILKEQAKRMKTLNKLDDKMYEIFEKQADSMISELSSKEAEKLINHTNIGINNAGYTSDLSYSIKSFAEFIYKGGEIYPSLNAPSKIIKEFPPASEFKQIDTTKLLNEPTNKQEEQSTETTDKVEDNIDETEEQSNTESTDNNNKKLNELELNND